MEGQLFDTEQKKADAINTLETGMISPFWKLLKDVSRANLEALRDQLEEGTDNDDAIRSKIKAYKELMEMPEYLIGQLRGIETEEVDDDPYDHLAPEVDNKQKSDI